MLDEIRTLEDKATEGLWLMEIRDMTPWVCSEDPSLVANLGYVGNRQQEDAEFIAQAREDLHRLVAALRAVESMHYNSRRDSIGRPADAPTRHGRWCYNCGGYDGDGSSTSAAIRGF